MQKTQSLFYICIVITRTVLLQWEVISHRLPKMWLRRFDKGSRFPVLVSVSWSGLCSYLRMLHNILHISEKSLTDLKIGSAWTQTVTSLRWLSCPQFWATAKRLDASTLLIHLNTMEMQKSLYLVRHIFLFFTDQPLTFLIGKYSNCVLSHKIMFNTVYKRVCDVKYLHYNLNIS